MGKTINVTVKRQASPFAEPRNEVFQVEIGERASVLDVLEDIQIQTTQQMVAYMMKNGGPGAGGPGAGGPGGPDPNMPTMLIFPHSCKVRKCGSCAILINGVPRLACETYVDDLEGDDLFLAPLSKFPVMSDLVVDKTAFDRLLEDVEVWLHDVPQHDEETYLERFESSRCINCGCCMEVCEKYVLDGEFAGPAAISNMTRIADELHDGKIREEYAQICRKHVTEACNCTQEVTCADVCPMEMPFTSMLERLKSL